MIERADPEPLTLRGLRTVRTAIQRAWLVLRTLSGDDAYERYLAHYRGNHVPHSGGPLNRAAFFRAEQMRKWDGVRRCC